MLAAVAAALAADEPGGGGAGRKRPGGHRASAGWAPLVRSRGIVLRLASLFALDSFAGGFIVQSFVVYWFGRTFGASTEVMGVVFFLSGLLQAGSSSRRPGRRALRTAEHDGVRTYPRTCS